MVVAFLVGVLASLILGPRTPTLGQAAAGDQELVADVRAALVTDRGFSTLSVGRLRDGQVSFAGLGTDEGAVPTPQTIFEMGSITKTMTGLLLADAVERGELRLADRLDEHLPELLGTPAGQATLEQLATHTSGLPGLPPRLARNNLLALAGNENPYDVTVAQLIDLTRSAELSKPGTYAYSNLGMSLLGHAEARAAGVTDWPTLATERLLRPLGMTSTTFALTADDLPAEVSPAHLENGWRASHWFGAGITPAGSSTYTTAQDLVRYAEAVLTGTAPGLAALEPRAPSTFGEIGLAWQTIEVEGRVITWHNGGTGGMRSMLAIDRERGQAVMILGNSGRWVDEVGLVLAAVDGPPPAVDEPAPPGVMSWALTAAAVLFLITFGSGALRARDRLALLSAILSGAAGLVILLAYGPWVLVPAWLWGGLAGVSVLLAGYGLYRARSLPSQPARTSKKVLGWLSAALYLVVLAAALWAL